MLTPIPRRKSCTHIVETPGRPSACPKTISSHWQQMSPQQLLHQVQRRQQQVRQVPPRQLPRQLPRITTATSKESSQEEPGSALRPELPWRVALFCLRPSSCLCDTANGTARTRKYIQCQNRNRPRVLATRTCTLAILLWLPPSLRAPGLRWGAQPLDRRGSLPGLVPRCHGRQASSVLPRIILKPGLCTKRKRQKSMKCQPRTRYRPLLYHLPQDPRKYPPSRSYRRRYPLPRPTREAVGIPNCPQSTIATSHFGQSSRADPGQLKDSRHNGPCL